MYKVRIFLLNKDNIENKKLCLKLTLDLLFTTVYNINMKEILFYTSDNGKIPVQDWINSLDSTNKARIYARFARIQEGNFGDYKKLDSEISEFRFKFGSGYRIYYSEIDNIIVLLINAGDKKSQVNDIKKAKEYLENWRQNQNG